MPSISASRLEINFRRLLKSCETAASAHATGKHTEIDESRQDAFLQKLKEDFQQLRKNPASDTLTSEMLLEYERKLNFLLSLRTERMKLAADVGMGLSQKLACNPLLKISEQIQEVNAHQLARAKAFQSQKEELLQGSSSARHRKNPLNADSTEDDAEKIIETQREHHVEATAELFKMASHLKENFRELNSRVVADNKMIDALESKSSHGHGNLVHVNTKLRDLNSATSRQTWMTIIALIMVIFLFIAMFIFMKTFKKK